ncbi:MAG: hypothetical protein IJ083_13160 [Clostridia bacterium]|nr:hypothetical protein [Clostridia bacterium]
MAQAMAEIIAEQNAIHNTLDYCLEQSLICRVFLKQDSWSQPREWWVLALSHDFVLIQSENCFQPDGFEIHHLSNIASASPFISRTEHCRLLSMEPEVSPVAVSLESWQQIMTDLSLYEHNLLVTMKTGDSPDRHLVCGRVEKIGRKRLTLRALDMDDLSWLPDPVKLSWDGIVSVSFATHLLSAMERLALSYDAFLHSIVEARVVSQGVTELEGTQDLRDIASEDLVDVDELPEDEGEDLFSEE